MIIKQGYRRIFPLYKNWRSAVCRARCCSLLFSYGFVQCLCVLRLACELFLLPTGSLGFLHAAEFLGGVFQTQVSVSVERDADIAVAHQVLQRLRIHPGLGLIAAVGMAADVRGDVRQLNPVDIVGDAGELFLLCGDRHAPEDAVVAATEPVLLILCPMAILRHLPLVDSNLPGDAITQLVGMGRVDFFKHNDSPSQSKSPGGFPPRLPRIFS